MNRNRFILLFLLAVLSLPLPAEAQEDFRDAYLPVKIELFFSYTLNFSLTVPKVGVAGSSWDVRQGNTYLMFECKQSRGTFVVLFEVSYSQPVEQIVTVKFWEGSRPPVVEYIHYTNGVVDPGATSREPPSASIRRRYAIRTVPEPSDPNEIVRLLNIQQSTKQEERDRALNKRLDSIDENITLDRSLWLITCAAFIIALVVVDRRKVR